MQDALELVSKVLKEKGYAHSVSRISEREFPILDLNSGILQQSALHVRSFGKPIYLKFNKTYSDLHGGIEGLNRLLGIERTQILKDMIAYMAGSSLVGDANYSPSAYWNPPQSPTFFATLRKRTPEQSVKDLLKTGENYTEKVQGLEQRMKVLAKRNLDSIEAYVRYVAPDYPKTAVKELTLQDMIDDGTLPG